MAGPATFLRLSAVSGLGDRFAPEAVGGATWAFSSCCRFRLASKCGGSSAPIPDILACGCCEVVVCVLNEGR